jgi:hypothetical protein
LRLAASWLPEEAPLSGPIGKTAEAESRGSH